MRPSCLPAWRSSSIGVDPAALKALAARLQLFVREIQRPLIFGGEVVLISLAGLPPTSLFRQIALDCIAQALLGPHNWASSLVTSLAECSTQFHFTYKISGELIPHL